MRKAEGITGLTFLRTIVYNRNKKVFHSPSRTAYEWDRSGVVVSHCHKRDDCNEKDIAGYPLIQEPCTCGFYGSHDLSIVDDFSRHEGAVWILVEALGVNIHAYTNCVRAPGAKVVAVVNHNRYSNRTIKTNDGQTTIKPTTAPMIFAQRYFNVPILTLNQARKVCIHTWTAPDIGGMKWDYNRYF